MGHAKDVWSHSSEIGANHYAIFAVGDQSEITEHAFIAWMYANNIAFKPLLGAYMGKPEHSFIVNAKHIGDIAAQGWLKHQESILSLGPADSRDRRPAKLIFLTNGWPAEEGENEKDLGVMVSADRDIALLLPSWTYDPMLKQYFITVDPNEITLDDDAVHEAWDTLGSSKQLDVSKDEIRTAIKQYIKSARR